MHSPLLRSEKQFLIMKYKMHCPPPVTFVGSTTAQGSDGASSECLGTKVRAPETHSKKQWQELTLNNPRTEDWGREELLTLVQFQT